MKEYKVVFKLITARLGKDLSLGGLVWLEMIGSISYFILHLLSFYFVVKNFQFTGWLASQLWIHFFTFEIITYLIFFTFWRGMVITVKDIARGAFDIVLAKPISNRLLAFVRGGGLHNLISTLAGVVLLIVAVVQFQIPVTVFSVVFYILFLLLGLWNFQCFTSLFIALNFRYGHLPGSASAALQFQELMKYPSTSYSQPLLLLVVYPTAALVTLPAASLLRSSLVWEIIPGYLICTLVLTILSRWFWNSSLKHYSSG